MGTTKVNFTAVQIRCATHMADELRALKLTVCLRDGHSGRRIRHVVIPSPDWYSRLCEQHKTNRGNKRLRKRTIIRRVDVVRSLARIIKRQPANGVITERLVDAIDWFAETRGFI
jgi:hypothetical protein